MTAIRKWRNRGRFTQMRLPAEYLTIAKQFLYLIDQNDDEALEIVRRRFLDKA
jgi:hypothetical protein